MGISSMQRAAFRSIPPIRTLSTLPSCCNRFVNGHSKFISFFETISGVVLLVSCSCYMIVYETKEERGERR